MGLNDTGRQDAKLGGFARLVGNPSSGIKNGLSNVGAIVFIDRNGLLD
jgi:hypothetical protein